MCDPLLCIVQVPLGLAEIIAVATQRGPQVELGVVYLRFRGLQGNPQTRSKATRS